MQRYVIRRLLWLIPVLIVISFLTFALMHAVPGGPWAREKTLAPQVVENLNKKYGLDKPFFVQYGNYLWNAVRGDLGVSFTYQDRNVTQIIMQGLPITATLGIIAFGLALIIGMLLGMAAALKQNSIIDYICVLFATGFASVPGFVLGILLMIIFSVTLHLLPTSGWEIKYSWAFFKIPEIKYVFMPAFALGALPAAIIARITRASILDVFRQDYIRTARAKGLGERVVLFRHILKNALIPVLTIAGPELAFLVAGSFIIESLFSVPGIGRIFVQGVFQRDYGLIMGSILFYAVVIAVMNLIVDILYAVVDPRVRYE